MLGRVVAGTRNCLELTRFQNTATATCTIGSRAVVSCFFNSTLGTRKTTYSSYARGGDPFLGAYHYLDITPKGRNETGPGHNLTDWVRRHDEYEKAADVRSPSEWSEKM